MKKKYRKCVGMMILNNENKILVGRRIDHPSGYWQMPQGGIDENEVPEETVWREMIEEIGTNNAQLIQSSSKWFSYDIPKETLKTLPWGNIFVGQNQKWFIFKFTISSYGTTIANRNFNIGIIDRWRKYFSGRNCIDHRISNRRNFKLFYRVWRK